MEIFRFSQTRYIVTIDELSNKTDADLLLASSVISKPTHTLIVNEDVLQN